LEQMLHDAYREEVAPHVIDEQQPASWPQDALHLTHGLPIVGDAAERESANDRVEALVGKGERLCVCHLELHLTPQLVGAPPGEGEHRGAQLHAREAHARGIEGEIAPRPDSDLEDLTSRLRAHPGTAV